MPLREDLLTPIAGENPSGENLYYDKVFDQIKEARREDADDLPEGAWERSAKKKADPRAVVKLAGDALATRSKDLRLAGWLIESEIKLQGYAVLTPSIQLLQSLQETFWPTIHPEIEDGTDMELRMIAVETAARLAMDALRKAPLTRSGLGYADYLESRLVGYEKDATTDARQEARRDAIDHGKVTAEDFDQAFATTPKAIYSQASTVLAEALEATRSLDDYQAEAYGDSSPNLQKLRLGLEEIQLVVDALLNERRKTDPDPVVVAPKPAAEEGSEVQADGESDSASQSAATSGPRASGGPLGSVDDAYALVVESAVFLAQRDPQSPVPYLACAALRLGETRMQGPTPAPGYAVGPSAQVRQSLRLLAARSAWADLMNAALPILATECARAWLDLHRYIWRAAQEAGAAPIADAVVGTVRSLLIVRPELRQWTLEDDTGAANPETQQWLDSTVMQ